jgi:hypothetical protein
MTSYKVRRFMALLVAVGTVPLLSGCPESALDITDSPSDPSQDFAVASSYTQPGGSYSLGAFAILFDTTVADAFARGTGIMGTYNADNAFGFGAYSLEGFARNASTDPRLPALDEPDADVGDFCVLGSGVFSGVGEGAWDLYCEVTGLKPGTRYTVMLVRYSLNVNAELDAAAAALGQPITAPDELALLGPNPQGYPTTECNFSVLTPVIRDANPLVLGFVDSDGGGVAVIDCVPYSAPDDPTWWRNDVDEFPAGVEDSIPFGPNTGADGINPAIPSFNYVVLVEGQGDAVNPVPPGPPALRWQVANDITTSNVGINNAIAPFPEQIPADELSSAPGFLGARPESMQATFDHLEALASGAMYEAWLANPATGSVIPATGTYHRIQLVPVIDDVTGEVIGFEEDTVETVQGTNRFVGGNDEFRHALEVSDATLGGGPDDSVGFHNYLMLTIAESPGGAEPAAARPFWLQYTDQNGTPDDYSDDAFFLSGTPRFGYFDLSDPAASRLYSGEGNGQGGVRLDPNGNVVSVDMRNLSRPPVGYVLVGWLERADGTAFRLPDITGPPPEYLSLIDADVDLMENLVTPNGVLDSNFRVVTSEAGIDLTEFRRFLITLEAKAGLEDRGPILVQVGNLPEKAVRPPDSSQ